MNLTIFFKFFSKKSPEFTDKVESSTGAPSEMIYSDSLNCYEKTYVLLEGEEHSYKFYFQYEYLRDFFCESGSDYETIPVAKQDPQTTPITPIPYR